MWLLALMGCKPMEPPEVPAGPLLVIEPAAVAFGGVRLGETGTVSVALRNEGDLSIAFRDRCQFFACCWVRRGKCFPGCCCNPFAINEHLAWRLEKTRDARVECSTSHDTHGVTSKLRIHI